MSGPITLLLAVGLIPAMGSGGHATGQAARVSEPPTEWTRRYDFDASQPVAIAVENVWGSVRVTGHDQPHVELSVTETRSARDRTWLEASREILRFGATATAHTLSAGLSGPEGWQRQDPCPGCRLELDIVLVVPRSAMLDLRTVDDGEIRVDGVSGPLSARHVNGPISVTGGADCRELSSVNGDIRIGFASLPASGRCTFHTINGDMIVDLPGGADADLGVRTGDGRVVSEFEVHALPPRLEVERSERDGLTRYRVASGPALRLGEGGYEFHFESMNGDVFVNRRP